MNLADASVVVCAYTLDRWDQLVDAVESAADQALGAELVIVIDHNPELLALATHRWPEHVVMANRFGRGLSGARNSGVNAATGDVIAFLDDDAVAAPGWLAALVAPFDDPSVGCVGGRVEPDWGAPEPAWLPAEFRWVVGCSYVGQPTQEAEIRNPIGASMAVRRAVFERVGGFREEIGRTHRLPLGCEETELAIRARRAGWRTWYQPDSVVHHHVPASRTTLHYFMRRCLAEGLSKATVSAMAGREAGLSAERTYVTATLPAAARQAASQAIHGPERAAAVGRLAAIAAGLAAAVAGYCRGAVGHVLRPRSLADAPIVEPIPDSLALIS
jgi:GT2 family glycosyltransferase